MQFCDECGLVMVDQNGTMTCANDDCGGIVERGEEPVTEFVSTEAQSGDEPIEIEEGVEFEGKPATKNVHRDDRGHTKAWYTIKQAGPTDELPTRFFKCQECEHRWWEHNQIRT